MNEKIKKIATWDGWTFRNNGNTAEQYVDGEFMYGCHHWQSTPDCKIHLYLTDLNWLIPVARKVSSGLLSLIHMPLTAKYSFQDDVMRAIWTPPNAQNEHTDLLNAVYEGIMLIEKYKTE